jgi:hypothetical protein
MRSKARAWNRPKRISGIRSTRFQTVEKKPKTGKTRGMNAVVVQVGKQKARQSRAHRRARRWRGGPVDSNHCVLNRTNEGQRADQNAGRNFRARRAVRLANNVRSSHSMLPNVVLPFRFGAISIADLRDEIAVLQQTVDGIF